MTTDTTALARRFGITQDRVIRVDGRQVVTAARLRVALQDVRKTDACWLFEGYRPSGQHGRIQVSGQQVYVHRAFDACLRGPIPAGIMVCHHCDVGNCIRPRHLFRGTARDNVADMDAKGRRRTVVITGEDHYAAHSSDKEVQALRIIAEREGVTQRDLAAQFGVSQSTAWRWIHKLVRS